jgi:hypothetical protein
MAADLDRCAVLSDLRLQNHWNQRNDLEALVRRLTGRADRPVLVTCWDK